MYRRISRSKLITWSEENRKEVYIIKYLGTYSSDEKPIFSGVYYGLSSDGSYLVDFYIVDRNISMSQFFAEAGMIVINAKNIRTDSVHIFPNEARFPFLECEEDLCPITEADLKNDYPSISDYSSLWEERWEGLSEENYTHDS